MSGFFSLRGVALRVLRAAGRFSRFALTAWPRTGKLLRLTLCLPVVILADATPDPAIASIDAHALRIQQRAMASQTLGPTSTDRSNGVLSAAVWVDGDWAEVGDLAYNQFPCERELSLEGLGLTGEVKVRLRHPGHTPAHIDTVSVDGLAACGVEGASEAETLAVTKLASRDFDLVDAQGKTLVLTFPPLASPSTLSVVARIEPEVISQTPYQFPLENLYTTMSPASTFYTYPWDSQPGALKVDGQLHDEALGRPPFFSAFCEPGSGHPDGYTLGWVRNDSSNLYVALDVTPDNTMDGDKDYAKVYVNGANGLKVFKVSVPETVWGLPGFTYTDRVAYQHKVYEFAIPVARIGGTLSSGFPLQVAFAAYGTVAPPPPSYPGPLDPSFSGDGIAAFDVGTDDHASDVVVQSTGKIVLGGYTGEPGKHVFALLRTLKNGQRDTSFGNNGVVTQTIGASAEGHALVLTEPADHMVLAGESEQDGYQAFTLLRTDSEGLFDPSFGTLGVVTTDIGPGDDMCYDVALQDDKLVAVGTSYDSDFAFAVARYLQTGQLDASFGNGGVVTTSIGYANDIAYGVAVQSDGKIVVVGYTQANRESDFAVARYESDGDLDQTFGTGGIVTTDINGSHDGARAVALIGDRVLVAGYGWVAGTTDFVLARYDSDGGLDPTFGTGGIATTDFGPYAYDAAYDMTVDNAQRIVLAGETRGDVPAYFALARYTHTGIPDANFGDDGRVNVDVDPYAYWDEGSAVVIQPNGRILVAGTSGGPLGNDDFGVVRYGRDLSVQKVALPPTVASGRAVRFRLTFSNIGAPAGQVRIDDWLPPQIAVTSVVSSGVPITEVHPGPEYTWIAGKLNHQQGGIITITGVAPTVLAPITLENTALIQTPDWDSAPGNNAALAYVTVEPFRVYLPLVLRGGA